MPDHNPLGFSFRTGSVRARSMVRVSVVIPIFNSAKTIARTLESVLNQDFAYGTEIIAVDDGSTDATAHELSRYSSRLRIISQENKGVAAAENAGAVAASGEYIAFCDADDVWMPDKLGATVAALDCNREAVLAYSDCLPVGDDGVPIAASLVPSELAHAPSMQELLRSWWPIVPSAAVIRRDAYEACGGQCTELRSYHDVYLWMLLRELGPFEYVARPLVKYRKTTVAERTLRDERYYDTFVYQVRARYQNSAETLLRATRHGCANLLGYRGLLQMRSGNLRDARHSFARALRREPNDLRNALRLMRTFLPVRLALRLGGRTCRPVLTPSSGTAREFPPGRGATGDESRRIQPHGAQSDRMTTHWSRYHAAWNKLAPPLRPNAEVCAAIRRLLCERAGPVLLLGVTPELADIAPRVVAVDRSGAMIAGVWPGNTRERRAVNGNWLTLPFAQRTFAAVVGDGTLNAVDHPSGHRQVYDELARVLLPGGRTVFRTFAAPRRCESVAQVRDDLMAGAIGSFHAFKWRLAMALLARQKSPNICVRTIHDSFSNEFPGRDVIAQITGWDAADIDTIDVYRHSTEIYSFPTIEQFQSIIPAGTFSNVGFADAGSYELADRCPLLFMDLRS